MKKLFFLWIITISLPFLTGCEDFLSLQSYTTKDSESFPRTEEDATQMLTGVYSSLVRTHNGGYFWYAMLAADERFGGGGINDRGPQAISHLLCTGNTQTNSIWTSHYTAIANANATLAALENMETSEAIIQKIGEAKILRAHFYFSLVQLLGDVPIMKSAPEDLAAAQAAPPQATQEEIYAFIVKDLWDAYNSMPTCKWNTYPSGTLTKWAAAGMLGRVYLFYTGFYQKSVLPMEGGGQVTGDQVAAALKDCIDNSGHVLVDDFRSLWSYTNSQSKPDYPYAKDAPTWVMDGENPEHIFVVKLIVHNSYPSSTYTNNIAMSCGPAMGPNSNYKTMFPLGQGWGMGPVNTRFYDDWVKDEPDDLRRKASIWHYKEETYFEGIGEARVELPCEDVYFKNQAGADRRLEQTGLWNKKIISIRSYKTPGGDLWGSFLSSPAYFDQPNDVFMHNNGQDLIWLRYADVLLMHSEITKTADGLNSVRARVNLPAVAYSLDAIQKERRHELAFEAIRWGDIRRWHIAEDVLDRKYGVEIENDTKFTHMQPQNAQTCAERYRRTKGFWPISQTQIDLDPTLKQNAGWENYTEVLYSAWTDKE